MTNATHTTGGRNVVRKGQSVQGTPVETSGRSGAAPKKVVLPTWDSEKDLYPLDAPGIRLPGPDFIEMAKRLGDQESELVGKGKKTQLKHAGEQLIELIKQAVYSSGRFSCLTSIRGGKKINLRVVSGHRWMRDASGPTKPARVMVLGKMLGQEEVAERRNLVSDSGKLFFEMASEFESEDRLADWYVTNLLKTSHPEGYGNSTLKQSWINEWLPILDQELRLLRPHFILCLGADASKALLGKHATVSWMDGRVVEHQFPIDRAVSNQMNYHTSLVMTITHPAQVLREPTMEARFKDGVARFVQLTRNQRWDREEDGLDHRLVDDLASLRELLLEVNASIEDNLLGVDAEWHGQHPENKGSYLRSFQVSWKHKTAATIVFRRQDGERVFSAEELKEVKKLLRQLCRGKQLAGHFFDADMEFLTPFGLDLREQYRVPDTWQEYMRAALSGKPCGFDTGLAAHALNETDDYSLTSQSLRYTTAPRYDVVLSEWKKRYCKENGLKDKDLEGYGPAPDDVLFGERMSNGLLQQSYSCYDPDVTRRLAVKRKKQLCKDNYGNNCWEAMWLSMRALPVVLEINTTGVMLDKQRADELTETYMLARASLEARIREWARWPEFRLSSVQEVREFLFGEKFNGKQHDPGTPPVRLRPERARSLLLTPIMSTDKRPMLWSEVMDRGLEDEKTPSTNKAALSILAQESQVERRWNPKLNQYVVYDFSTHVNWIRDHRFISQVLKSILRPPVIVEDDDEDSDGGSFVRGEDGHYVYSAGLAAAVCGDGRIRTHIYPTKETGRWSSARPPLHNLSKRRESDYKRIIGPDYKHPLRSIIMASPGTVLVEADFVGAELYGGALMSGDARMIEHCKRNQLPEHDPDFYDIHSNIAVMAFRLDCPPTKAGLETIDKAHLRIVAKSVIFGLMYGRAAKAIALAAKEEGITISVAEAQCVIDTILQMYAGLEPFFEACRRRVTNEKWICGAFGRFRRFVKPRDRTTLGDLERQGMNFPIQNLVADAMDRAVDNLDENRRQLPPDDDFWFKILLQIHDALLFEVEYRHVARLVDETLPLCMVQQVPLYPSTLDGFPRADPGAPYFFGVDTDVCHHWGELMYPEEFLERGIEPRFGGWSADGAGWRHSTKNTDKIWVIGDGWNTSA